MKQKCFSQEGLKTTACVTMLLDHIGATIVMALLNAALAAEDYDRYTALLNLYYALRIIGRIAFPIYCFLLVEGSHHTRNPDRYALRLAIGVLLAELPFDLALNGGLDWRDNSVMLTLLLGFYMLRSMEHLTDLGKAAVVLPFYLLAEWLGTDYGGNGIAIIALLALTRGVEQERTLRILGLTVLLNFGASVPMGQWDVTLELFGLLALIPIFCYNGEKLTHSKKIQLSFYLFYPAHLLLLWLMMLAL